jgi:predicted amino acid-binding ACT domain protein
MTNEKLYEILGDINEEHIKEAGEYRMVKKPVRQKSAWRKWGSLTACIAVVLIAAAVVRPMLIDNASVTPPVTGELKYESRYVYHVDRGAFSDYVGGKVIAEDKIGVLASISMALADMRVAISSINTQTLKSGEVALNIQIGCKSTSHYESIVSRLRSIPSILSVSRGITN